MTDLATRARNNAISLEVKKDGLQQRQSGDWMLRFTVAGTDMDNRLTNAAMGTRYACVLVEINDDETPVDHEAQERDKWRDLGPAKQAALRCKEPVFWAFLRERWKYPKVNDEATAANAVRDYCGVRSRADLNRPEFSKERLLWAELDSAFHAWRLAENG
jgi:hypothetical protein